jgi:hypothetical protein
MNVSSTRNLVCYSIVFVFTLQSIVCYSMDTKKSITHLEIKDSL